MASHENNLANSESEMGLPDNGIESSDLEMLESTDASPEKGIRNPEALALEEYAAGKIKKNAGNGLAKFLERAANKFGSRSVHMVTDAMVMGGSMLTFTGGDVASMPSREAFLFQVAGLIEEGRVSDKLKAISRKRLPGVSRIAQVDNLRGQIFGNKKSAS